MSFKKYSLEEFPAFIIDGDSGVGLNFVVDAVKNVVAFSVVVHRDVLVDFVELRMVGVVINIVGFEVVSR